MRTAGAAGDLNQKILLTGVNLTSIGTEADIISNLLLNGKLLTD